jgi:DNA-binding response OmpR family regulator
MLSAISNENAIVRGLDMEATDYVTKPFSIKVLIARAKAAIRQSAKTGAPKEKQSIKFDDNYLSVDIDYRRVSVAGEVVHLTDT